ncbi:hypothetical protein B0H12DRAFT_1220022 [Mycena haematopus]|nr:hypothetical protein B0H12DRAFT_1220022 [Mycena haematopus]
MWLSLAHRFTLTLLCCSLLSQASLIPPFGADDDTSAFQSPISSLSATATLSTFSPVFTLPAAAEISRHPRPSSRPFHHGNVTGLAISNAGIVLFSAFMVGLVGGLATCAWSYWRTPHRTTGSAIVRGHMEFNAQWLDTLLGGEGLLRPPPPPYFPRPPSYHDVRPMVQESSAARSLFEWEAREPPSSSRRHSV